MKAATVKGFGSTARIVVGETKRPKPGKSDVLVEVHCSSVNPKGSAAVSEDMCKLVRECCCFGCKEKALLET